MKYIILTKMIKVNIIIFIQNMKYVRILIIIFVSIKKQLCELIKASSRYTTYIWFYTIY